MTIREKIKEYLLVALAILIVLNVGGSWGDEDWTDEEEVIGASDDTYE